MQIIVPSSVKVRKSTSQLSPDLLYCFLYFMQMHVTRWLHLICNKNNPVQAVTYNQWKRGSTDNLVARKWKLLEILICEKWMILLLGKKCSFNNLITVKHSVTTIYKNTCCKLFLEFFWMFSINFNPIQWTLPSLVLSWYKQVQMLSWFLIHVCCFSMLPFTFPLIFCLCLNWSLPVLQPCLCLTSWTCLPTCLWMLFQQLHPSITSFT